MAERKKRLELTWIGKEERPRLEPRILLEDADHSYHAAKRVTDNDVFDNRLIHGDNLLALKALEQEFAGKIKCVYIDPPYNTGSAFAQYDDGLEHSLWLSLIRDRIELLWALLREDGSIWISIDDNEAHYLKVLCDELFGRANFIANMIWEKRTTRENRRVFSFNHDHVLVYAKCKAAFESVRNPLPLNQTVLDRYKNPDADPRGPWQSVSANAQAGHATASQFYDLVAPSGVVHRPPEGRCWLYSKERMAEEVAKGNIWFGKDGKSAPRIKKFLRDAQAADQGLTPETLWRADEVGTNDSAKKHLLQLFDGDPRFDTPKPEELIARILQIATNPGDLVLDSFLGSGTTAAVAQKLGRGWIGVELGEHATACCVPRLRKVIDGGDPGGVTNAVGWQGGGGFRFFKLAPSLLEKDKWGNWVVSKNYHPEMLAEAMCKIEGFHYAPDPEVFWIHGKSTETDFIYVTTQNLSREQLRFISDQVGSERTLLICCAAFRAKKDDFSNLTVKKIPQAVLSRCEWGRDDYSLNVEELPAVQIVEEAKAGASANGEGAKAKSGGRRRKASAMQELPLFAGLDTGGKRK
ncbi:MAG: site-specific DNA-methyltransferase [Myxococcales bacterium]|nr:site-specific DNA-methyltransferase [Myxococcales bacterium]